MQIDLPAIKDMVEVMNLPIRTGKHRKGRFSKSDANRKQRQKMKKHNKHQKKMNKLHGVRS